MTQEIINIGTVPNDGEGDPLRTAFTKINNNFTQLYSTGTFTYDAYSFGNTAGQIIFETPANLFTQGTFQINSNNPDTDDSQNIILNVAISNDVSNVKWNGHSTLFFNDPVTTYNIDLVDGNIRLLVNPLVDANVYHFIAAQITFNNNIPGMPLELEGLSGDVLGTENIIPITTEQPA
jgi:hypothetical protein